MTYYQLGSEIIPVQYVQSSKITPGQYKLTILDNGIVRISFHSEGTHKRAFQFFLQRKLWIQERIKEVSSALKVDSDWPDGTRILYLGEWLKVRSFKHLPGIQIGTYQFTSINNLGGLKFRTHQILRQQAENLIPAQVKSLSKQFNLKPNKISIRNQKSKWGTCSKAGNIALNWRLIQCPEWVSDYVILHELQHLKDMRHSYRFWKSLCSKFPHVRSAEAWLKDYSFLLLSDFK